MSSKVSFLFGAGAEGKFNQPFGAEFMKMSYLDSKDEANVEDQLKKCFTKSYFYDSYSYSKYTYKNIYTHKSIIKKWVFCSVRDVNTFKKYIKDIRTILNKEEFKNLINSITNLNDVEEEGETSINQLEIEKAKYEGPKTDYAGIISDWENLLLHKKLSPEKIAEGKSATTNGSIIEIFFNKDGEVNEGLPIGISHILDGHFHTIINPYKFGSVQFSKVFNYYWTLFFAVYKPLLEGYNGEKYKFDYETSMKNLKDDLTLFYKGTNKNFKYAKGSKEEKTENHNKTYYHLISEKFVGKISGIITTNYFKFAEEIIKPEKTAYLNGQLKLFEIPETLEVIDVTEEGVEFPTDKLFFPFVFGQSYTKPIVSKYQIEEFYKMGNILKESDTLVVLGYNVNEDDNHVNAYLRDFIKSEDNRIIVVSQSDTNDVHNKLRLKNQDNIVNCQINYNWDLKDIVDCIYDVVVSKTNN